jgi:peptide/nickel transport system ATP-binding protein
MSLLAINDLTVHFATRAGTVRALDRVALAVAEGEILGIVGESGSGKSVTAFAAMRLLDPASRIVSGSIGFAGQDVLALPEAAMRRLRGAGMAMVFQSPRTALNPIRRVGAQIADALIAHHGFSRAAARHEAVRRLAEVRIPDPERRATAYPFELSGGMCQRVLIALALAGRPRLLIADEPTTGLDATVQAVVLALLADLVRRHRMGLLFITHDLLLAAEHCDRIAVMHAGQVVEVAPATTLFKAARHPYTRKLLATAPRPGTQVADLAPIAGTLPDLRAATLPACRYEARCERALPACATGPIPEIVAGAHTVRCLAPL